MGKCMYRRSSMSRTPLTVLAVTSHMKRGIPKLYSDGACRGLYLKTTPARTASWIFRWRDRATGKLRDMGLGPTDGLSLAMARTAAADLRRLVAAGEDPI